MHQNQEARVAPVTALPPVRWSNLKWMGRSPAHFRYYSDNPVPETDTMRLGAYAHALVLGTELDRFVVWQGGIRSGKDWKTFAAENATRTILLPQQAEAATAIADAVLASAPAMERFFGCVKETTRAWTIAGRECVGTPDAVGPGSITELKITADSRPGSFQWHARKMGWLGQLAWYDRGLFGDDSSAKLSIVAVESKPPYVVQVWNLTPNSFDFGRKQWRSNFERLLVCEQSGEWPGYCDAPLALDVEEQFGLVIDGEEHEL